MGLDPIALALSAGLVLTVAGALFAKGVSNSLIMLFYSSVLLGLIFTYYGDALIGLVEMATFAGAISVVVLTVVIMTGKPGLEIGGGTLALTLTGATVLVVGASAFSLFVGNGSGAGIPSSDISQQVFAFVWEFRPWDLLVLVVVFAATIVTVVNLFSGGEGREGGGGG